MQEKYQENYEYRGHNFTIGLLVGSHHYGIIIDGGSLITTYENGAPLDGTLEDAVRYAEQLIDDLIAKRGRAIGWALVELNYNSEFERYEIGKRVIFRHSSLRALIALVSVEYEQVGPGVWELVPDKCLPLHARIISVEQERRSKVWKQ